MVETEMLETIGELDDNVLKCSENFLESTNRITELEKVTSKLIR